MTNIKSKIYKNIKSGDIREITFHGKIVRQIYINGNWKTIK
jgi:hypothetical protein